MRLPLSRESPQVRFQVSERPVRLYEFARTHHGCGLSEELG